jgi:hypothetical protein
LSYLRLHIFIARQVAVWIGQAVLCQLEESSATLDCQSGYIGMPFVASKESMGTADIAWNSH